MKASTLLVCLSLLALSAFAQEEAAPEPKTTLVKYMVPKSSVYYCQDLAESARRYERSKEMTTADVYALKGGPGIRVLKLILREAPIREFGGGSDEEPSVFAIDVTTDQDAAIKKAIEDETLFIMYYHWGW